jgi:Ca-activated chloride channel family protein
MKLIIFILLANSAIQAYSQAERKYIRKGNSEYEDGRYQQAEIEYRKALEKDPQSSEADYNLGNALYRQKQYDAAATKYNTLAGKGKDSEYLNRYYYNLGNALFENQKYQESVEAFKSALRNDSRDMDAKHNLQMALKMLNENKQQQNQKDQQKNKDQQSQSQQNKDQQNKDQGNKNQQEKNQQQGENNNEEPQPDQMQGSKGQITREDAERILQALENDEKNVMKKVLEQKEHIQQVPLDKNW